MTIRLVTSTDELEEVTLQPTHYSGWIRESDGTIQGETWNGVRIIEDGDVITISDEDADAFIEAFNKARAAGKKKVEAERAKLERKAATIRKRKGIE